MKKRFLSLALATCLFATMLTGCGNKSNSNSGNDEPAVTNEASKTDKSTL